MRDSREIFWHVIARRSFAADCPRHDDEIPDLDMILERAAAADANQKFRAGGTENFSRHSSIRREATAVSDGNSLPVDRARIHFVIQERKILGRILHFAEQ